MAAENSEQVRVSMTGRVHPSREDTEEAKKSELPDQLKEFHGKVSPSDMNRMVAIERDIAEVMHLTDGEQQHSPYKKSRN